MVSLLPWRRCLDGRRSTKDVLPRSIRKTLFCSPPVSFFARVTGPEPGTSCEAIHSVSLGQLMRPPKSSRTPSPEGTGVRSPPAAPDGPPLPGPLPGGADCPVLSAITVPPSRWRVSGMLRATGEWCPMHIDAQFDELDEYGSAQPPARGGSGQAAELHQGSAGALPDAVGAHAQHPGN